MPVCRCAGPAHGSGRQGARERQDLYAVAGPPGGQVAQGHPIKDTRAAVAMKAAPALVLRPGTVDDADACGRICYEAFASLASGHGFPPDFPSPDVAIQVLSGLLSHPGFYSVVAESDGEIVGSNFLDERSPIAGVGPITVDPAAQNAGVGRQLMIAVLERAGSIP